MLNSVEKPKMTKIFGTSRIPWGLARNRSKFVPSFDKEDWEARNRVRNIDCLVKMTALREEIKEKLLTGRHNEVDEGYSLMRAQIYDHLK